MATQNNDVSKKPSPGKEKPTSADQLVKGDKTKTELTEDDLKDVSGGLKLDYKE